MKPSQLICRANQLTGFYMMRTLVVKGLSYCEIFKVVSVISTKLVVKKWKSYSQRQRNQVINPFYNPLQNILRKIKKSREVRKERETLISAFAYFMSASTKNLST